MPPLDSAVVVAAVRDYVARAIAPLNAGLANLGAAHDAVVRRLDENKPMGPAEIDAMIRGLVATAVATEAREALAAMPKPEPGLPGKDADPVAIAAAVREPLPPPEPGPPGKNADPEAVKALLLADLHWVPIPKDGKSVTVEELRPLVVEEISNTLALIPKPKDGAPGRDAAQIEVAAAIDEGKSYPRGTYAKHANGFWRAYETTEGMRGWECLVAGIAGIEVLCNHEREFQVVHTLSDGKQFAQTFELPVLIYRGVFAEGREYHRGDQVSWGAHQWHCNEPTHEKPIEGGKAWTLAVKRGRDGKPGEPGPPGKDRIVAKEKA